MAESGSGVTSYDDVYSGVAVVCTDLLPKVTTKDILIFMNKVYNYILILQQSVRNYKCCV